MKLKINCKLFLLPLLQLLICSGLFAQGLTIGANTEFNLGSAVFSLSNNWSNSGTFDAENGTVVFSGPTGNQSITNAQGETFKNLTVNKAADDVILQNDIDVTGTLTVTSGDLDLNGKVISMGASAGLVESADATVKGTAGYITATRDLNAPAAVNVAGFGAVITSAANLGSTEIKRGHAEQSCGSIYRYFDISPTTNTGLNATLVFHYDESELHGMTEADLQMFISEDAGASWNTNGGTLDAANNFNTLTGLDSFSRWTLSANSPPVLAAIEGAPLEYKEDDPATPITNTITLTDVDDVNIESAIIQFTGNYQNGEDELRFTNTPNITGVWSSANANITLTGTDTKANYQAALRNVKYINTNTSDPVTSVQNGVETKIVRAINATPRTVSFTVNDGNDDSNTITRVINITPLNDVPVSAVNTGAEVNEGESVVITNQLLRYTDPDGTTYFTYTLIEAPVNGELKKGETVLAAGGTFTQADINGGAIVYTHNGSETTSDSFRFEVADNNNATAPAAAFEITIIPGNNPPLSPTNVTVTFDENGNIVITWYDSSGNELGFYVWRQIVTTAKLNVITEYEKIATLDPDTEIFVDENIEEGVNYSYKVTAFNADGESAVAEGEEGSEVQTAAPLRTPTNLAASDNGNLTITIEWDDNSSLETGYIVERKTSGDWEEIFSADENATTYTDVNVEEGITYYYRVKAVNAELESVYSNECEAVISVTDVEEWMSGTPTEFTLNQNYPNPFNPATIISYGLPESSNVRLVVYNMLGQEVAVLVNQQQSAGYHSVTFNADGINSGIYLYKIEAGSYTEIRKCILMK